MSPANEGGRRSRGSRPGIIADHEREVLQAHLSRLTAYENLAREHMGDVLQKHPPRSRRETTAINLWRELFDHLGTASRRPRADKLDKARSRVKRRAKQAFEDLDWLAWMAHQGDEWARGIFTEIGDETRARLLDTLEGPIPQTPSEAAALHWTELNRFSDDKPMDDNPWMQRSRRLINDTFDDVLKDESPESRRQAKQAWLVHRVKEGLDALVKAGVLPPSPQSITRADLDALDELDAVPRTR